MSIHNHELDNDAKTQAKEEQIKDSRLSSSAASYMFLT